ncbi:hypothetical protein [Paraburkholderia sp.]|uniref:hypothetical protein n=1 Tax=Paraburkholderia sp. TaxID=1926495 RepID=UPI002F406A45
MPIVDGVSRLCFWPNCEPHDLRAEFAVYATQLADGCNSFIGSALSPVGRQSLRIRWLILGESGYGLRQDEQRETEWMIRAHNGDPQEGWKSIRYDICTAAERLMTGSPQLNDDARLRFWNTVAFYNFVRESMPNAQVRPTKRQFTESRSAFSEVIQTHKPHVVLEVGSRLDHM